MEILLAVETAASRAPQLSGSRLLNFMTERQPPDAKSQAPLFGAPGIKQLVFEGDDPSRGSWDFNWLAYYVQGADLFSVASDGTKTNVGTGIGGTGPVDMDDNGEQMCIVNGLGGFIYTTGGGLVAITSPNFYPADTVLFFDGYFVFDRKGTNQYFLSALYDGLTYDALMFASAEAAPGFMVATAQNLQLLYVFTTSHIELWYDAGTPVFPFQRYAGGVIPYGCASAHSIVLTDSSLFFLATDKVFYRLQANVPIRVSTHPIERLLSAEADLSQVICSRLTIQGHKLIFMVLPTAQMTLCYDISTGKWHERDSLAANGTSLGGWRGTAPLEIYGQILIGDTQDGRIGLVDWTTYKEYDRRIIGLVQSNNQHHDRQRLFCSRFELDVEAGVGLTTGQGDDPQIRLRRSIDGGRTWGILQPPRSMGKIGEYAKRLRWMGQGQGFQFATAVGGLRPGPAHNHRRARGHLRAVLMANPDDPVIATFPVPPPAFNFQFVQPNGMLTVMGMQFLQILWASIQGGGGVLDLLLELFASSGQIGGIAEGLIEQDNRADLATSDVGARIAAFSAALEEIATSTADAPVLAKLEAVQSAIEDLAVALTPISGLRPFLSVRSAGTTAENGVSILDFTGSGVSVAVNSMLGIATVDVSGGGGPAGPTGATGSTGGSRPGWPHRAPQGRREPQVRLALPVRPQERPGIPEALVRQARQGAREIPALRVQLDLLERPVRPGSTGATGSAGAVGPTGALQGALERRKPPGRQSATEP